MITWFERSPRPNRHRTAPERFHVERDTVGALALGALGVGLMLLLFSF